MKIKTWSAAVADGPEVQEAQAAQRHQRSAVQQCMGEPLESQALMPTTAMDAAGSAEWWKVLVLLT